MHDTVTMYPPPHPSNPATPTASVLATADSMGRTALQIAQKSGNRAAAELLSCRTHQYTHRGGAPGGRVYRKQQHA